MTSDFHHIDDADCRRFQGSLELIGRRWSSAILLALARGHSRFGEILSAVPGLSDRLLSVRLKELEHAEIVERQVIGSTPVQVRYGLTAQGLDLITSLQPLVAYGQRWHDNRLAAEAV